MFLNWWGNLSSGIIVSNVSRNGFEKGSSSLKKETFIIINNNIVHAYKYQINKEIFSKACF